MGHDTYAVFATCVVVTDVILMVMPLLTRGSANQVRISPDNNIRGFTVLYIQAESNANEMVLFQTSFVHIVNRLRVNQTKQDQGTMR